MVIVYGAMECRWYPVFSRSSASSAARPSHFARPCTTQLRWVGSGSKVQIIQNEFHRISQTHTNTLGQWRYVKINGSMSGSWYIFGCDVSDLPQAALKMAADQGWQRQSQDNPAKARIWKHRGFMMRCALTPTAVDSMTRCIGSFCWI